MLREAGRRERGTLDLIEPLVSQGVFTSLGVSSKYP